MGSTTLNNNRKVKNKKIRYKLDEDEAFHAVPCELLIIGEDTDGYGEQNLLSIQSGRIYLGLQTVNKTSNDK